MSFCFSAPTRGCCLRYGRAQYYRTANVAIKSHSQGLRRIKEQKKSEIRPFFLAIPNYIRTFAPQTSQRGLICKSPDGGIGRRAGLKHQWGNPCRFDPGSGYEERLILNECQPFFYENDITRIIGSSRICLAAFFYGRRSEAKHCSSLCSQSEGGEDCGGQARAKRGVKAQRGLKAKAQQVQSPIVSGQARAESPASPEPRATPWVT